MQSLINLRTIFLSPRLLAYPNSLELIGTPSSIRYASAAATHRHDDNEQLLQRSIVPTMHFQKSLPRLPVPKLEKTIERYVKSQEALLDKDKFERTKKIADSFLANEGKELHEQLLQSKKKKPQTSYISDLWFDMYLASRSPMVINYNPFIAMNDDPVPGKMQQAVRAADLTYSAMRFRNSLNASLLKPDVYHMNPKKSDTEKFWKIIRMMPSAIATPCAYAFKAFPLDMSQYENLFNSTRIPRPDKDVLMKDPHTKHIAVLHKGHFYTFDVIDQNGDILTGKDLKACYEYILKNTPAQSSESIAVLSAAERNDWAKIRHQLVEAGNEDLLRKLDSAVFVLSLDTYGGKDLPYICKSMLHGDGYNRWFDKSFSLIVDSAGRAAVNFEHAWGDGVAVLRFVNEIYGDAKENNFSQSGCPVHSIDAASHVRKLDFKLTPEIRSGIDRIRKDFEKQTNGLDLSILEYGSYGKDEIKKLGFYPDGIMQLAFQMAFYRMTGGQIAPTYESCSTAAFKHGRTECIRSATNLTKQVSERIIRQKAAPSSELKQMVKQCTEFHGQLTKEAAMGQGFDRHLFALKKQAEVHGRPVPEIFTDPSYAWMNHNILSTSTLQSPAIQAGGFAPVVSDGFGLGYSCMDHMMGCVVFYYPQTRNGKEFTEAIRVSFDDLMQLMKQ